jgi:hypothetical protein
VTEYPSSRSPCRKNSNRVSLVYIEASRGFAVTTLPPSSISSIHASLIDFPLAKAKWVIFYRSSHFSCGLITLYFLYSLSYLALVLLRGLMRALSSGLMQIMIKYRTFVELALYFSLFSIFYLYFSRSTLRSLIPLVKSLTGSNVVDSVVTRVYYLTSVYSNLVWSRTKSSSCPIM